MLKTKDADGNFQKSTYLAQLAGLYVKFYLQLKLKQTHKGIKSCDAGEQGSSARLAFTGVEF